MFKKTTLVSSLILTMGFTTAVSSADIAAGKEKAAECIGCHGAKGISNIPTYPNLAGQKAAYTAKQLRDFKSKVRPDVVMAGIAAALTDKDIENLSAYYESLK